ncbi:hypothetical protein AB7M47_008288 [Bradyrhizobium elkanii]
MNSSATLRGRQASIDAFRCSYSLSHCDFNADSKDSQGVTTAAGMLAAIKEDLKHTSSSQPRLLFHVVETTAKALPDVLDGSSTQDMYSSTLRRAYEVGQQRHLIQVVLVYPRRCLVL